MIMWVNLFQSELATEVDLQKTFLLLGGTSLQAIKIITNMEERYKKKFEGLLENLLGEVTLEHTCVLLSGKQRDGNTSAHNKRPLDTDDVDFVKNMKRYAHLETSVIKVPDETTEEQRQRCLTELKHLDFPILSIGRASRYCVHNNLSVSINNLKNKTDGNTCVDCKVDNIIPADLSTVRHIREINVSKRTVKDLNSDGNDLRETVDEVSYSGESKGDIIAAHQISLSERWCHHTGKCIYASCLLVINSKLQYAIVGSHSYTLSCVCMTSGKCVWTTNLAGRIEGASVLSKCGKWILVGECSQDIFKIFSRSTQHFYTYSDATGSEFVRKSHL